MQLDHLVLAARTLDDGVAWCEATLGIVPGPGGEHALMGTHNRLFGIASARFPRAYFEVIAINPKAPPPGRARWFDLDDPALQRAVAREPRLIHWVVRCDDIRAAVAALRVAGIERGEVLQAERNTPRGMLRWQITVRADGQRLFGGALPTLIQWGRDGAFEAHAPSPASGSGMQAAARTAGEAHPADTLPPSGVALTHVALQSLPAPLTRGLPAEISIASEPVTANAPAISVTLSTARGPIVLQSPTAKAAHAQP
jgi:Glyoxalase-like domain